MTVLEALQERLHPQYIGWRDVYAKAALTALEIPHDMPMDDLTQLLEMYKDSQ